MRILASIIIPAHNESLVINKTINALLPGISSGQFEIIVICNGCSDNTAELVRAFGNGIICVETAEASKSNALNIGDSMASWFPRIYLDADVILPFESVIKIAQVLRRSRFLAASPRLKMNLEKTEKIVRQYYEVWQKLPYVQNGMIGTGVYALSEQGRNRFSKFPRIIADDGFVRALFREDERVLVDSCYSFVNPPKTLEGLLKIKARSRLGRYELREKFPELMKNEEKNYGHAIWDVLSNSQIKMKFLSYLYVNLLSRYRAYKIRRDSGYEGWERDNSSRLHFL